MKSLKCTKEFQLTKDGVDVYSAKFTREFFKAWCYTFPVCKQPNTNAPGVSSPIEMDCLIEFNEKMTLDTVFNKISNRARSIC